MKNFKIIGINKTRRINNSVLYATMKIFYILKLSTHPTKYESLFDNVKNKYLIDRKSYILALNLLFALGIIYYDKTNDTIGIVNENNKII